jgi:hypothetical protein
MERLRFLAAQLLAVDLACAATKSAIANIIIHISKPTQTMTVTLDGQVQYRWRVSTGATGYSTPVGSYTAFRMEVMHYSREWDNAGMPHAIFFTKRGTAFMAPIIHTLVGQRPTVASVSRCQTPPGSISLSRRRVWGIPRSSFKRLIPRVSQFQASRQDSGRGSDLYFSPSTKPAMAHEQSAMYATAGNEA